MKKLALSLLVIPGLSALTQAQDDSSRLYIHAFRAPSTGFELRKGNVGIHAGYYTTILESGAKSTEFWKLGGTYYYRLSSSEKTSKLESYFSLAYMRGINGDYEKKDAGFLESGFSYQLGGAYEFRLGTGLLFADGFRPKVNPTVGISYTIKLK